METPTHSPPSSPHQEGTDAPLFSSPLTISLSFKNGQTKTLERFLTARIRFETPDAERAEIYKVFQHFDTDGDGNLSVKEIKDSLEKLGIIVSAADIASVLSILSADNNGHTDNEHFKDAPTPAGYVDFPDFYQLYRSLCQEENEEGFVCTPNGKILDADLRSAFDLFDKNHDNFISATELQSVLLSLGFKEANNLNECKSMIASVDSDGDGMVNFDEFKAMMRNMNEN
ncbi:hypothetical protein L7F22_018198 [Adiantum nelumboides]|nr:hypothetical protein [Adiantum nelumboides]